MGDVGVRAKETWTVWELDLFWFWFWWMMKRL